jgi:hypothetical protein
MPASRDAALFAALRRAPAPAARLWRLVAGAGLAAAVALAATVHWYAPRQSPAYARTGDIRDAYSLARALQRESSDGKKTPAWWDANHDGRVDSADVDALALAVVQLNPPASPGGVR